MTRYLLAFLALFALTTTPALATSNENFTGVRAELTAGLGDVTNDFDTNDFIYGAAIGVDVPLGSRMTLGAEINAENVFDSTGRTLGAEARLGFAATDNFLVYGAAGYENYEDVFSRSLDGLRVGGGAELAISPNSYVKVEYRYADLQADVGRHGGLIGVGLRF